MGTIYDVTATSDETCGGFVYNNTDKRITITGPSGGALASGIRFATAPASGTNIFNSFYLDTQSFTWQGPYGTNPSSNVTYEIFGDRVILAVAPFTGTSGGTSTWISSSTAIPAALRPAIDRFYFANIEVNNAIQPGVVCVRATGVIEMSRGTPSNTGVLQNIPIPGGVTIGSPLAVQIAYSLTNT